MIKLGVLSVLLFVFIDPAECVDCYTCNSVIDDSVCTANTTTCGLGQSCFKSIKQVNGAWMTTLGCQDNQQCSGKIDVSSLVGRDLYSRHTHNCMECCSADMCNMQLCNHERPTACVDDDTVDCARLNSIFTICEDIHHAKDICPKFCDLCNVVDGEWTNWSEWSNCNVTCDDGTETRSRSCTNPRPEHGGLDCVGNNQEGRPCYTGIVCPVDGGWSVWNTWGSCSVSCDTGIQRRTRTCSNPTPAYFGDQCFGHNTDDRLCSNGPCADGGWSSWSSWSKCSATCGVGTRSQSRACNNPVPSLNGQCCFGDSMQVDTCSIEHFCRVNGEWSGWSEWSHCDVSCNNGTETRNRSCSNPQPEQGGLDCEGDKREVRTCHTATNCPVDGEWSEWSEWSPCNVSCSNGTVTYTRSCTNPQPEHGGRDCVGNQQDVQACYTGTACPVDGGWSVWNNWGSCSTSCDTGIQRRTRNCSNPTPAYSGDQCFGQNMDDRLCSNGPCADGGWSSWSSWSKCSATCGVGIRSQSRACNNPVPSLNGQYCIGDSINVDTCSIKEYCRINGEWSGWSEWSHCAVTCNNGTETRNRSCSNPQPEQGGLDCEGDKREVRTCHTATDCPVDGEWSEWSERSPCDVSCSNGTVTYTRSCTNPQPEHGGRDCVGNQQDVQACYTGTACPVDGGWSVWNNWGSCSTSCDTGIQRRTRNCSNPTPAYSGDQCFGQNMDDRLCSNGPCADGDWSSWSSWSKCSATCGVGIRSQSRACNNPVPSLNGQYCIGDSINVDTCSIKEYCGINGEWSGWSEWSHCDVSCNNGTVTRTRSCTNPRPEHGGLDCVGDKQDVRSCYTVTVCPEYPDCSEIKLHKPNAQDGIYYVILWKTTRTIQVYCDMTTDGGGWTVFQNRYDGSVDFYRNYSQYVHGFGDLHTEFWLGLDYIQEMTSQTVNELRIDLVAANGTTAYEVLRPFSLSSTEYILNVGNTTSSKNIDLASNYRFGPHHNGSAFSAYDHDVDSDPTNCATVCHGSWWYNNCYYANLNGQYLTPGSRDFKGMIYHSFILNRSLQLSKMAFRRK